MLNKIMVAIDGSPLSFQALDFAMGLGKACGSRLLVLHVSVPFDAPQLPQYKMEKLEDDVYERILNKATAKEKLTTEEMGHAEAGAIKTAKKKAAASGYEMIEFKEVVDREPAKVIVQQSVLQAADALIVGSSGLGLLSSALLGSVSNSVIANSRCPVIVVR